MMCTASAWSVDDRRCHGAESVEQRFAAGISWTSPTSSTTGTILGNISGMILANRCKDAHVRQYPAFGVKKPGDILLIGH
jgi:hypothetical protein